MQIFGAVSILHNGHEIAQYHDDDIAIFIVGNFGQYGIDWRYAGDQSFEESNIVVDGQVFKGVNGLTEALSYIRMNLK